MRADEIHPGDLIAGKYRVRAILGRNHGLLVEAFHTEFDQRVVIKVLLAGSGDEREIERFRRESRVLAKLASEHAARIIDVGTEPDGSFYLVREYLDGTDLGTFVQQHGALPLVDAVLCVLQVAEAVAETHGHGIIVRELGPSHLFLTQRAGGAPLIKIGDFGTAKLMREAAAPGVGAELTATAMFGLSPYASPELLRKARSVDARTDVWSLGAIFYELLTGRPPFVGETTALMLAITREEPTPPSHLVPGLPPELDPILGWALAKDVDGRFKNVHAFAHALAPYASPEGQVLIDRIAQIDEVARGRRRGGSVPPAPPSFPSARAPGNPVTLPPPAARPQPITTEESVTDVRLPREAAVPGQHAARALPPPPAGQPMGMVPDLRSAPASAAPPAAVASPPLPSAATAGGRRAALLVIALSAVLVPVLLVLLLLKRSGPATGRTTPSATPAGAATTPEPAETAAAPAASAAPSATASAEPASSASAAASTEAAASASAAPTASAEASAKPSSRGSRAVAAAPAPPPPPPPSAGGATGTLLAVVVGGTCAFQVNGASKGSGASLKLALKPGTYAVVCRPSAGGAKSKSVTVRSGETAMAAFKL
jgi:serine/threonine-protein kinase